MTDAQSAETADVRGLLGAAYVYLNQFVPVDEARVNGFDVLAWCDAVDRLRCEGPLEGGDVWGTASEAERRTPHGASPPSSGHEPEASYQRQAEADFGAGRGSDTKGAGSPDIPRPTNLADICVECGSGLLKGQHIADYPCLRRAEVAERERDQARQALDEISGLSNVGSPVWEIANAALEGKR